VSCLGLTFTASAASALPPDPPAAPAVVAGNGQITVSFSPPANDGGNPITGYLASCTSSDGGSPNANTGTDSPITVDSLTNGNTYTCTVIASNVDGPSSPSAASSPTIPNTIPDPPAQPTAIAGNSQLTVSFSAPFDGGSPITQYLASCTSSDGGTPGANTGTTSPIIVSALDNAHSYSCTVIASNMNGPSADSPPSDSVTPSGVPDAPPAPSVTPGNAQIAVGFTAPGNDGGSAITGYLADCTSTNGSPGANTGATSPIIVAGLTNGDSYTCSVIASNTNGAGAASPASAAVIPSTVPGAPAAPGVSAGNALITATFKNPPSGGKTITGYRLTCSSSNGGRTRAATGAKSPITVASLTNGKSYTCRVSASNANGAGPASLPSRPVVPVAPVPLAHGYRLFSGDGGVFTFGSAGYYGAGTSLVHALVICMMPTSDNRGYWLGSADGAVFPFGDARSYGSALHVTRHPIVGCTPTPSGHGYWLVASDGGIFGYGDARFYGSTGAIRLARPIVAMTSTPSGHGYWFVASDGGIFGYGDAHFYGSAAGHTSAGVVGMATTATGRGYWLAGSDGRVYAFGDAHAYGSAPASALRLPIMGIVSTPSGHGYWLVEANGGVFKFGDAPFYPWTRALVLRRIIRGMSR